MKNTSANATLRKIAGHLVIDSDALRRQDERLQRSLARSVLSADDRQTMTSAFSISTSDLFFDDVIPAERRAVLDRLAERQAVEPDAGQYRVFVREVPVRDPLLRASVPDWAAGARVDHTIGPFTNSDGRRFWFDFFPLARFSALYIQGIAEPVLLYTYRPDRVVPQPGLPGRITPRPDLPGRITPQPNLPGRITPTPGLRRARIARTDTLVAGSIWINARMLAPNAPAGTYTGLSISGGSVAMSSEPGTQDGKRTVPANTTLWVTLDLDRVDAGSPGDDSPYGMDAKTMALDLPERFAFHFSAQGRTIDQVDDAGWELFGQSMRFAWQQTGLAAYDPLIRRIRLPFSASETTLQVRRSQSPFNRLSGSASIIESAWVLPAAAIDITQPTEASGTGGMLVRTGPGITDTWERLKGGGIHLASPYFLAGPGQILLGDTTPGNPHAHQRLALWRDETNPFGSTVDLSFPFSAPFFFASDAGGSDLVFTTVNADFSVDRPVMVNGQPPKVRSQHSLFMMAATADARPIALFDDNLIQDAGSKALTPMSLALTNALFRVSPVNGCLLFGSLTEDFSAVDQGFLFLTFGLYSYLPTLPDPYAANLGVLRRFLSAGGAVDPATGASTAPAVNAWLVSRTRWQPREETPTDAVRVSFHFAPAGNQFAGISLADDQAPAERSALSDTAAVRTGERPSTTAGDAVARLNDRISSAIFAHNLTVAAPSDDAGPPSMAGTPRAAMAAVRDKPLPDYESQWDEATGRFRQNLFALLDVSTNADLFGVSFNLASRSDRLVTTHVAVGAGSTAFPLQARGMSVVSQGRNVKAFTVPQISWEPLLNLTAPQVAGDPPLGNNYYPNDGGPMQILNNSEETVALAPLPVSDFLVRGFDDDPDHFTAFSLMTLPFGLKALAVLQDPYRFTDQNGNTLTRRGTGLRVNAEAFTEEKRGGLQLQVDAGEAFIDGESDMFVGSTLQLNNVLDFAGNSQGDSTLGRTVTEIFNNEFLLQPFNLIRQRGVPLTRIDLSGYGASTFSNWLNPTAAFAETSQAKFDVFVGRCAHEIIQVKSIVYPWGIKVVRTITIFRVGSGYVYRFDSGWRAESSGRFDFRYFVNMTPTDKVEQPSPFAVHPGIVSGLYNVENIVETDAIAVFEGQMVSPKIVDENGLYVNNPDPGGLLPFKLQPVYFDADIDIENPVAGFAKKKIGGQEMQVVPSKKILGYVQSAPRGIPISPETLRNLVLVQMGAIGGPVDCEIDLAGSGQKMRLARFDFSNTVGANGTDIVFAAAGRGSVLLPGDGAWTLVRHSRDSGEVTPVPADANVPVIRQGRLVKDGDGQKLDTPPGSVLLRIANPSELLRAPMDDTVNFGFLQSTDTQKALFLTPSFEKGVSKLFSKTPPLFVDAFRIANSKGIFPNIGDAETDLGDAISLISSGAEFLKGGLKDLGQDVWELMDLTGTAADAAARGYQLLKQVATFDLPNLEFALIDVGDGNFRIYIEYKQSDENGNLESKGALDFSIDALANDVADTWKSRMGNIALVVDLAGIDRLMTIRGTWDSKKGSEAAYPQPQIRFAKELQPVIDILEILQQLQGGDYAGAVAGGLKLAMSNKAGTWEYKFEATKEIPVLRFPVPDAVYNDPNTPFKLEAGLTIGAYFNAAVKVTNDLDELLPSAGGLLGFYGRLSVMCVSLSAATVYAIGQVNLDIAADTQVGPSLRMKFGFGAQIVVGLPVAGNVSVTFVVGVEIYAASGIIELTAFMLFEGHAEILGGLVSITIRIEAKGTVSKKAIGGGSRTDLACQVTFGLDISIFLVINISFETSWSEQRQIA